MFPIHSEGRTNSTHALIYPHFLESHALNARARRVLKSFIKDLSQLPSYLKSSTFPMVPSTMLSCWSSSLGYPIVMCSFLFRLMNSPTGKDYCSTHGIKVSTLVRLSVRSAMSSAKSISMKWSPRCHVGRLLFTVKPMFSLTSGTLLLMM